MAPLRAHPLFERVVAVCDGVVLFATVHVLVNLVLRVQQGTVTALWVFHVVVALSVLPIPFSRKWLKGAQRGQLYSLWIYLQTATTLWVYGSTVGVGAMMVISVMGALVFGGRIGLVLGLLGIFPVVGLAPVVSAAPLNGPVSIQSGVTLLLTLSVIGFGLDDVMRRFSASHDEVSEALSRALEERAGREKAIQALERQRRMDALGRLSGGIAHDVNNALVVVVANTTALLEEETDPDQRQVLRDMLTAARSAGETVQQLMIFSQRAPSNAPADTAQVVTQLARSLRRVFPENIHITVTATGPLWVTLPVAALERVLLNLSLNARDAMPMGGELSIQAHPHEPGQIAIVVGDTGLGMTEAVQKRAFEPFFTTKTELKGTGLGLSSVQEIVVKAGGTIALESALGEGTRVTLHLPQTAGPPTKDAEPTAQRDGAKIHILLVEDEPAVRKATGRMLELIGHSFVAARDERTAMLAMDVSGVPFDLMLTDGVMPQTNTDQLIQGFRERFPQAGVVLYSGWLSQSTITADEHVIFMAKPFSMTQLEDAITQAIQPR